MNTLQRLLCFSVCILSVQADATLLCADQPDAEGIRFFEQKIRPVLVEHCYECHSEKSKPLQAEFLADSQNGLLTGGASGPAIVPGKPSESLLLSSLKYNGDSYDMPPKGKLPDTVIADFEKWIAMGAPDPRIDVPKATVKRGIDFESGKKFWSLQPPKLHPVPSVTDTNWPKKKLDYFILAAQEKVGLHPASQTDRRTLIRRASMDLTGLPPTFEETEAFVRDSSPDSYEKLIDRLLASPRYGERWARHWLDVVRYAEDNVNMGPHNGPYHHAYRYRDWVVGAVNADMPYNEFVLRQLAADFLPDSTREDLAALGLLGLSPQYHKEVLLAKIAIEGQYADEWEDRVDVVSRGLLGLTVACARCHDHKYDPISTKDYYALAGVFASIRQTPRPLISDEDVQKSQPARDEVQKLLTQVTAHNAEIAKLKKKEVTTPEQTAERDENVKSLQTQIAEKRARIKELEQTPNYVVPSVDAVTEEIVVVEKDTETRQKISYVPNSPRDLPVFIRGNITSPGEIVPRRFLEVLSKGEPVPFKQGSGRLELAEAIVSPANPLTARVFVNRVWMHHFGEGLVDTPSNFGETGSAPSHPELLDDLAVFFMNSGWSLKSLHREIMLSATYQQSSSVEPNLLAEEKDADNRLLWRFNRRRLDAEALHDVLLVAGGNLDLNMGGPSASIDEPTFNRRSIYATISRNRPSAFLQVNDFPDPTIHAEKRALTTTPLQQLFVLNSPFVRTQAILLSERIAEGSVTDQIQKLHQVLFKREATPEEVAIGLQYLSASTGVDPQLQQEGEIPTFTGHRMKVQGVPLGETYSIEIWFRNTVPYQERPITGYLFSRGNDKAPQAEGDHIGIGGTSRAGAGGKLLFFNGNRAKQSVLGKTVLEPDRWHHIALIRSGQDIRIYLDGQSEPDVSGTVPSDYDVTKSELFFAGRNDNFANFLGQMGGVTVYNRVLTPKEISIHYDAARVGQGQPDFRAATQAVLEDAPTAHWALYSRSALNSQARDITPNGHHGIYEDGLAGNGRLKATPWILYCHAMLCSNELLYVD
ncbi:DUF1553 domain-containing protein [Planctomicrobium sp. SH527]|uniref:DUF1553 domain-containing protein n=1 Tax=Planctomicrobium sp. SH527 TaxID=3448123 RepID=UPI003F5C9DF6